MAKGKKNKQNKNIDVVQQLQKQQKKEQQGKAPQQDQVKQTGQTTNQPEQASKQSQSQQQKTSQQLPTQTNASSPEDTPTPSDKDNIQQNHGEISKTDPEHTPDNIDKQHQLQVGNQNTHHTVEEPHAVASIDAHQKGNESVIQSLNSSQPINLTHTQQIKPNQPFTNQDEKIVPAVTLQPINNPTTEEVKTHQAVTNQDQKIVDVATFQNQAPVSHPINKNQQEPEKINQPLEEGTPEFRRELLDGLKLVGQAAQQILYENPLKHEAIARGQPQFIQSFQPAIYHLSQRLLQEQRQGTPPKDRILSPVGSNKQAKVPTPPRENKIKDQQILQQIKQSAESLDPDPLQLEDAQDSRKVNVLKSDHSQSEQQKKQKVQQKIRKQSQSKKSQRSKRSSEAKKSETDHHSHQLHQHRPIPIPVTNPNYINPLPETQEQQSKPAEKPRQLDYNQINQQMLKQRQVEWKKLQSKQLQPLHTPYVMLQETNPKLDAPPVSPNRPQSLPYTNNLPIIQQQRTHTLHNKIQKQTQQTKQKLLESQKLKKQIENQNPIKKIAVSALVTAAAVGACVLGKADKRIAGGIGVGAFVLSYLVQK